MAFDRNYDTLIALAGEMGAYEQGYLDADGEKAAQEARVAYATERNRVAYAILSEKPDLDLVYERIRGDLASIAAESGEGYEELCAFVAEDLIEKLEEESAKSPLRRTVVRYGGMGVLAVLVVGYLFMFWYNDLTVDQPIETKEGLIQHAAAFDKASTYNDWNSTSTRRGGAIKGLLLWPWEPDDQEFEAAGNFAGVTLNGLEMLSQQGAACPGRALLVPGEYLSELQTEFVEEVSDAIQADGVVWEEEPIMTLLPIMAEKHPCETPADAGSAATSE
ncbi:MAG: hypothetical protein SXU28_10580 [Pseudomonadota bacterium]|nr:hypothetical protein [Pseudomonadota bacterium]